MKNTRVRRSGERVEPFEWVAVMAMAVLFLLVLAGTFLLADITNRYMVADSALALTGMVFALTLFFCCMITPNPEEEQKRTFEILTGIMYLSCFLEVVVSFTEGKPALWPTTNLCYTMQYLLVGVYWVAFWHYQRGKVLHPRAMNWYRVVFWVMMVLYMLMVVINAFTNLFYSIGENGFSTTSVPAGPLFSFGWCVFNSVYVFTSESERRTKWAFFSYSFLPMLIIVIGYVFRDDPRIWSTFGSVAALAYLIPLYLIFSAVYAERTRRLTEQERELAETRVNASVLQINPHFIANTLTSIASLCDFAPQEAAQLTNRFAVYLRENYTDLTSEPLIPFSKELEHLKNYLEIERVRFPDIRVEYDVQSTAFMIPSLTIQPLVENAVRHGLQKKVGGGTIRVTSSEAEDAYTVRITDDGIGYHEPPEDDRKHVGIANARTRLALLCNGTLTVTGQEGAGTVCEIVLPKPKEESIPRKRERESEKTS